VTPPSPKPEGPSRAALNRCARACEEVLREMYPGLDISVFVKDDPDPVAECEADTP
jgi:hypothetical protein